MTVFPKEFLRRRLNDLMDQLRHTPGRPTKGLVVVGSAAAPPVELTARTQIYHTLPASPARVLELLDRAADSAGRAELSEEFRLDFAWHAAGLTATQIGDSLRRSVVDSGRLTEGCLDRLRQDKRRAVRRSGLLELRPPGISMTDVVGLDALKEWVEELRPACADPILSGILAPPRGLLLGGLSGCGKSLAARAIAGSLDWPLLRLDLGRVFGVRLGESERNLGRALDLVERMSPAVVWIDEIEKGLGTGRGAATGTTARVFQHLLFWLQERTAPALLVATANDGTALPPELIRAGRFGACFFLDLPTARERAALIEHALVRTYRRSPVGHEFAALAQATAGYTSAELVGRVEAALFHAAAQGAGNPTPDELTASLTAVPAPAASDPETARRQNAIRAAWRSFARPASAAD